MSDAPKEPGPTPEETGRRGGLTRAKRLSPEERADIASKAAAARWKIPSATHEGVVRIGDLELPSSVLPDGRRVLSERGVLASLGIKVGGVLASARHTEDGAAPLPLFVGHKNLRPFIDDELATLLRDPVLYRALRGGRVAHGVRAELVPKVCEVWLKARDAGVLNSAQRRTADLADIMMRGLAHVGIIALVDEATGYQAVRERDELHKILAAYIAKELLPWTKRFPDEFYKEMFRLRRWRYQGNMSNKGPRYAGKLTNEVVYKKLPPGVLEELRRKNPTTESGHRKHRHHQFLTPQIGNPHLEKHLAVVTALMRASPTWGTFRRLLEKAVPSGPTQGELFADDPEDDDV